MAYFVAGPEPASIDPEWLDGVIADLDGIDNYEVNAGAPGVRRRFVINTPEDGVCDVTVYDEMISFDGPVEALIRFAVQLAAESPIPLVIGHPSVDSEITVTGRSHEEVLEETDRVWA